MHPDDFSPDRFLDLGIFAKTFPRTTIEEVFEAIVQHGLRCTQWNWACVRGLSSLPEVLPLGTVRAVKKAASSAGVRIVAISATFNLIQSPAREQGLARLATLARAAVEVGCDLLTLCTGTRHPLDMWTFHPGNGSTRAWSEMMDGLRQASRIVAPFGVRLGIEPETANVISDASSAQRALDELGSDAHAFAIVLDAANLYRPPIDPRIHPEVMDDAVACLGNYIGLAHAKDIAPARKPSAGVESVRHYQHTAAGTGILPYAHYLRVLFGLQGRPGRERKTERLPLILHGLDEEQVSRSVSFLRSAIEASSLIASQ